MITIVVLIAVVAAALALVGSSVRIVTQYERGIVFRFGRVLPKTRGPGLAMIAPVADRLQKVNMQIVTLPVPSQDGIIRDNVTVRVDAVVYYRVVDPVRVAVDVQDYGSAIQQVAQASCARSSARANWMTCCPTSTSRPSRQARTRTKTWPQTRRLRLSRRRPSARRPSATGRTGSVQQVSGR